MTLRALSLAIALGALSPGLALAASPTAAPAAAPAAEAAPASDPAGAHAAIAQAQERLAEIDATITVMQDQADKADAAARQKARDAVAALKGIRDTYKKELDEVAARGRQMTADQLAVARAALTAPWTQFQQALDQDVRGLKLDVAQRKAIVEARIKAEQAYWQGVIADLKASAADLTAEQRAAIDARIAAVQGHAEAAKLRLTRLARAGQTAWSALKQGLVNSRQVFDDTYRGTR